jgi:uncharacterized protein YbaR (Trm112 family)
MVKCSFCEQPLVCHACKRPFQARTPEGHVAVFQPDMQILCPGCQQTLICRACGYVYGEPTGELKE